MRSASVLFVAVLSCGPAPAAEPIAVGSRRELFADDYLVGRLTGGARLRLHRPTPREVALVCDRPWEGNGCNYVTVFRDGERYRMYYRGSHAAYTGAGARDSHREVYCYAESRDGIHWSRPDLGLFAFDGSKKNNIVLDGVGTHAFAPFRDGNPKCPPGARYKALGFGGGKHGLYAFKSSDGVRWSLLSPDPVITRGAFDSQNLAFWDEARGEYREYHRDFRNGRDVRTATSRDFLHWTEPRFLEYADWPPAAGQVPDLEVAKQPPGRPGQLYTNQILPYPRAPHLFLGFPTRYLDRGWTESARALPRYDYRKVRGARSRREGTALTEGLFMVSRDGGRFAVWGEAFLRPGLRTRDQWFYGDGYQNWGLVETKAAAEDGPPELSVYVTERYAQDTGGTVLRRHTLRLDGFVSVRAPLGGGELVTKVLTFRGRRLTLNCATSTAGGVRVEIQDGRGQPIPGFALGQCHEVYGDDLQRTVSWRQGADVGELAGRPVRLRFALRDADVFSFQFVE
jgi:hypothetical protein